MGNVGCTSFFPSKNLGCYGDGGAMYTDDDELAKKLRMIANHGQSIQYHHDIIGVNSRLDSIQAAILRAKLPNLDLYNQNRARAAAFYDDALASVNWLQTPKRSAKSTHVFHQYTLKLKEGVNRDSLRNYLSDKGIPSMIYYPVPLHLQKAYKSPLYPDGHFSITEKLSKTVLSLPMHSELDEKQLTYITQTIQSYTIE
ncbi:DegT/DnrJ/EryC1/StrS family aminotransferase [Nitritalea halalkaliphila]|uniref:DegT/DnrJ/EryC1/StrS family aminotransferase n=1 Tax=Nitritalea halalkaliphila TaxID=590849 RepID=UPI00293527A0|nr:DegT/DnrJ/EryC1/StrS family aminotransferase [Nitritalea halalkaliphila]